MIENWLWYFDTKLIRFSSLIYWNYFETMNHIYVSKLHSCVLNCECVCVCVCLHPNIAVPFTITQRILMNCMKGEYPAFCQTPTSYRPAITANIANPSGHAGIQSPPHGATPAVPLPCHCQIPLMCVSTFSMHASSPRCDLHIRHQFKL